MTEPGTQLATVVGFVFEDLPGLNDLYLPASPGLTVLYGLNGAGKTRVLQGLDKGFRGVHGGAQLLIRVPDPEHQQPVDWEPAFDGDEWSPSDHSHGSIKAELCRAWSPESLIGADELHLRDYYVSDNRFEAVFQPAVSSLLNPEVPDLTDPFLGPLDPRRIDRVRGEMLAQRLVLVTPAGSVDFPSWTVSPAAIEDDSCPAVGEELRRINRTRMWEDAGEHAEEVPYPNHGDPYDAEALALVGRTTPLIGAARGMWHSQSSPFTMSRLDLEPVEFEHVIPRSWCEKVSYVFDQGRSTLASWDRTSLGDRKRSSTRRQRRNLPGGDRRF